MDEITLTRHNELIDPIFEVWGWEIPVYLFIGGMVAGMMILSGYFFLRGRDRDLACVCYRIPLIGLVMISLGMLALFLDLEHKAYVWRLYTRFEIKSPMSWGSWILLLVYPALMAAFLMHVPDPIRRRLPFLQKWSNKLRSIPDAPVGVGKINIAAGVLLGTYTGVLLSSLGARPLWNSAILGLLFLVSGLSTAAALVHMMARDRWERETLARADNMFLTAELVIIALLVINMLGSSEVQIRAAMLLLTGPYAASFWVFVVLLGILVPLFIQTQAVKHKVMHTPVGPLLVILGGLILRFILVGAGQSSQYAVHAF